MKRSERERVALTLLEAMAKDPDYWKVDRGPVGTIVAVESIWFAVTDEQAELMEQIRPSA